ncbi:Brain-specific angiogenesis inhibitor 1-associated protein 2 [Labeo rohita]|uniref:Brain-specific angiogenesis inhibitor 1-associated protein 2 n=1 Tax=Labeo rohita TaxID=84645 RepID=A0ABQ8M5Y8_LABRO|nr:Brain-specific angiogenesis inhibitor 1-associated protein 2 [Labeo rohita]
MEQFNPCLRNFVAMGKTYEKALSSEYISGLFIFTLAGNEPAIQALVSLISLGCSYEGSQNPSWGFAGVVNMPGLAGSRVETLHSVTFAAKGYFDALVRMGELASESHGSKDLVTVEVTNSEVNTIATNDRLQWNVRLLIALANESAASSVILQVPKSTSESQQQMQVEVFSLKRSRGGEAYRRT